MGAPVGCESIGPVTRAALAAVSRVCDERLKDRPVAMRPCERPLAGGGQTISKGALVTAFRYYSTSRARKAWDGTPPNP